LFYLRLRSCGLSIRIGGRTGLGRRSASLARLSLSIGHAVPRGSKLDELEKRWRRLVGPQPRERRCTFRCSTDCAYEACAAFFRLRCQLARSRARARVPKRQSNRAWLRVHDRRLVSNAIRGRCKTSSQRDCRAAHGDARVDRCEAKNSFFRVVAPEPGVNTQLSAFWFALRAMANRSSSRAQPSRNQSTSGLPARPCPCRCTRTRCTPGTATSGASSIAALP
jgi:hypothetical protein